MLLDVMGNPNRLKILALLMNEPLNFRNLLKRLDLKKSALANHLIHLMKLSLVEKVRHGMYSIMEDATNYLGALGEAHMKSKVISNPREMRVKKTLRQKA